MDERQLKELAKLESEAHAAADALAIIEEADEKVLEAARKRVQQAEDFVAAANEKAFQAIVDAEEAEAKKAQAIYDETFKDVDLDAIPFEEPLDPKGTLAEKQNAAKAARIAKSLARDKARIARQKARRAEALKIRAAADARKQAILNAKKKK